MPYIEVLQKYAVFEGRASRREFWLWLLFHFVISFVIAVLATAVADMFTIVAVLYGLATIVPHLAVGARRLHDHNKSGWLQLVILIPFVGWIIVLILMVLPGNQGENKHGPQPS